MRIIELGGNIEDLFMIEPHYTFSNVNENKKLITYFKDERDYLVFDITAKELIREIRLKNIEI